MFSDVCLGRSLEVCFRFGFFNALVPTFENTTMEHQLGKAWHQIKSNSYVSETKY